MSGQFRCLHPYVSQRIVSLFETLARKYMRLEERIKTAQILPQPNLPPVDTKTNVEEISNAEKDNVNSEGSEPPMAEIAPDLVSYFSF